MSLDELRQQVYAGDRILPEAGLRTRTSGSVCGRDITSLASCSAGLWTPRLVTIAVF